MLADVLEIRRVVIACGYTDLRKGNGRSRTDRRKPYEVNLNPFQKEPCSFSAASAADRIKGPPLGRNRVSPSLPKVGSRLLHLAKDPGRSCGDHGRTVPDAYDGAQPAPSEDPECIAEQSLLNFYCAKQRIFSLCFA